MAKFWKIRKFFKCSEKVSLQTKYLVWKTISEWELWGESNTGFPVLSWFCQYFFWKFLGSLSIYSLFLKIHIPTTESQCTESWNHWGWKRHPRSPSPTRTGQCHSVWFETLQWTFLQVMNVFLPLKLYFGNNLLRRKMNSRYSWTKRQWRHRWKYSKAWKVKAFQIPAVSSSELFLVYGHLIPEKHLQVPAIPSGFHRICKQAGLQLQPGAAFKGKNVSSCHWKHKKRWRHKQRLSSSKSHWGNVIYSAGKGKNWVPGTSKPELPCTLWCLISDKHPSVTLAGSIISVRLLESERVL